MSVCRDCGRSIIVGRGAYSFSCIRVHILSKQWTSKEMNNTEHEYMNMGPQLPIFHGPPFEHKNLNIQTNYLVKRE